MPDFLVVIKYNDSLGENEQFLIQDSPTHGLHANMCWITSCSATTEAYPSK